ncbi:MAG: family 10 glycosylhydrolase [Blastocatellia bacterium]
MRWVLSLLLISQAIFFSMLPRFSPVTEVRGVWVDRSTLASRDEIRGMMRQLADANFNLVLINVWSRGYPLWPSKVFERETGILIDPNYAGRDVVREAVEEAEAAGIHLMPWPEYGFIGGYSGYFPGPGGRGLIFERHPDWLARTRAGETPAIETLVAGVDVTNSRADELIRMIEITREKRLPGVVVWYYQGLVNANAFGRLKQTVFADRARLPWAMPAGWQRMRPRSTPLLPPR